MRKNYIITIMALWFILNSAILLKAITIKPLDSRLNHFYPFNITSDLRLWAYDFSEFFCYTILLPAIIFLFSKIYGLAIKNYIIAIVIYFYGFAIISLIDNYSLNHFYLSLLKGSLLFLLSYKIATAIIGFFTSETDS